MAPGAPTVASFSPDSGTVGDGITNANHITLAGTAVAGSTVEVFDGATQIGTATANASGAWTFATATLADGSHAFTAKAMDAAGNLSTASAALTVTIDTVAPGAPTVASFSPDSGTVGDGITNANHITLAGTAVAGSTVEVFDGATQIGTAMANGSGAWTFATATLADGSHAFTTKAMDAAGNLSTASAALTVTVDTVAPGAPTVASFSPDSGTVGDGITNANHITLAGTAVAGSTVEVFDGATQIGTAMANGSGAWTLCDRHARRRQPRLHHQGDGCGRQPQHGLGCADRHGRHGCAGSADGGLVLARQRHGRATASPTPTTSRWRARRWPAARSRCSTARPRSAPRWRMAAAPGPLRPPRSPTAATPSPPRRWMRPATSARPRLR